jgi:hypothetical protein
MSLLQSRKGLLIIGGIIALIVVGSILKSVSGFMGRSFVENAIERATNGEANVEMKNDGTMDITTKEGTFSTGQEMPKDWPSDVAAYDGATVTYSASMNKTDETSGSALVLMTKDSANDVKAFYESSLKTNGWSITNTMQGGGTVIMTAEKDGRTLSVAIAEAEGQTSITIGVEAAK